MPVAVRTGALRVRRNEIGISTLLWLLPPPAPIFLYRPRRQRLPTQQSVLPTLWFPSCPLCIRTYSVRLRLRPIPLHRYSRNCDELVQTSDDDRWLRPCALRHTASLLLLVFRAVRALSFRLLAASI